MSDDGLTSELSMLHQAAPAFSALRIMKSSAQYDSSWTWRCPGGHSMSCRRKRTTPLMLRIACTIVGPRKHQDPLYRHRLD